MKHYFNTSNWKIVRTASETVPPFFKEFTEEQEEFILLHPEASYFEIQNTELISDRPFNMEQYKLDKINELSELSLLRIREIIPEYRVTNALAGIYTEETQPKKNEILEKYNIIGTKLRQEFYRLKQLITHAIDKEEIDHIYLTHKFNEIDEESML